MAESENIGSTFGFALSGGSKGATRTVPAGSALGGSDWPEATPMATVNAIANGTLFFILFNFLSGNQLPAFYQCSLVYCGANLYRSRSRSGGSARTSGCRCVYRHTCTVAFFAGGKIPVSPIR